MSEVSGRTRSTKPATGRRPFVFVLYVDRVTRLKTDDDSRHHPLVVETLRQRERKELIDRQTIRTELESSEVSCGRCHALVTTSSKYATVSGSHLGDKGMRNNKGLSLDAHPDANFCLLRLERGHRQRPALDRDLRLRSWTIDRTHLDRFTDHATGDLVLVFDGPGRFGLCIGGRLS